jgi:hypothetical protein
MRWTDRRQNALTPHGFPFTRVMAAVGRRLLPGVLAWLGFLAVGQVAEAACGGSGQEPCSCTPTEIILEGCEACRGTRFEIPFANQCTDTSGWPAYCGGTNEPICSGGILQTLGIGACKLGRINVAGTCRIPDSDGYPTFCGGSGERPCRIDEKVPACKLGLLDIGATCVSLASLALDDDHYPRTCGDLGEPVCLAGVISALLDLGFPIQPCKPHPPDTVVAPFGICVLAAFPDQCGRNGQRPCTLLEHIPSCMSGLRELPLDFGVCGTDPIDWGESDADEASRGGPRTVFFIHGRNTDYSEFGANALAKKLLREAANVSQVYGIDWHNKPVEPGSARAFVRSRKLLDTGLSLTAAWQVESEPWGTVSIDAESFEITQVAYAAAQAIRELPTDSHITIIATSFGGVIARQLVYRHYDELRKAGKRITEVITMGSPHRGGLAGDIDYDSHAAALQKKFACLDDTDHNGCQLGEWIEWMDERERGFLLRAPWFIDNRDYPQIRWITLTSNGSKLDLSEVIDPLRAALADPPFLFPESDARDLLDTIEPWNLGSQEAPFPDSDGVVTVRSAFGIRSDECYPFLRSLPPNGSTHPTIVPVVRRSKVREAVKDDNGQVVTDAVYGSGDSATCYHVGARVDPRVREGDLDENGQPNELFGVGHADTDDGNVQDFILATLNLLGDTTGDGRVDENDLVAEAGGDYSIECTGPSTLVHLDAGDSFTGNVEGLSYHWTGPFGAVEGPMASVPLPLGAHTIRLALTDPTAGFTSTDDIVVTVKDETPPGVTVSPWSIVEATSALGTPFAIAPEASDLCSEVTIEASPSVPAYPLGTTLVTLTATDSSGNHATATTMVEVVDTTPPHLVPPPGVAAEANAILSTVALGEASATDIFPVTVTNDAPATFPLGTTPVVWSATDANGNSTAATQLVTISDTTPPDLTLPADVVAEANGVQSTVGIGHPVATDIFPVTVSSDAPSTYPLGTTHVLWTARDANGNETSGTQAITVVDTTPPVVTPPPDVVVVASGSLTAVDIGLATATDIFGATLSSDAPASFPIGTTTVTWTGIDGNGNVATARQLVKVTYQFDGFEPPVRPGGTYRVNRTLPLKFALSFADSTPVTSAVAALSVFRVGADDSLSEPLDVGRHGTADGGNLFGRDGNHYQFNLGTRGWAPGRYRLSVALDDGQTYSMDVTLR